MSNSDQDLVKWHPVLYRWDGVRFYTWKKFDRASAYAKAMSNGSGHRKLANWRDTKTHDKVESVTFKNLPAGPYTVIHVLAWESNGKVVRHVSPNWCDIQK